MSESYDFAQLIELLNTPPRQISSLPKIKFDFGNDRFMKLKVGGQQFRKHLRCAVIDTCLDDFPIAHSENIAKRHKIIHDLFLLVRYSAYKKDQIHVLQEDLKKATLDPHLWHEWIVNLIDRVVDDYGKNEIRTQIPHAHSLDVSYDTKRLLDVVNNFESRVYSWWLNDQTKRGKVAQIKKIYRARVASLMALKNSKKLPRTRQAFMTPQPWNQNDPAFHIAREKGFFGHESLHPTQLSHTLVLGGTGCGKSQSVVIPLMNAMIDYKLADGTSMSMLVIDPKRELAPAIQNRIAKLTETRKVTVVGQCPPIKFFEEDIPMSPRDKVAELRQLLGQEFESDKNSYWHSLADAVVTDLLRLEQDVKSKRNTSLLSFLLTELMPGNHIPSGFWHRLQLLLGFTRQSMKQLKNASTVLEKFLEMWQVQSSSSSVFKNYTADGELIQQWNYIAMSADVLLTILTDADFCKAIDADPNTSINRPHMNIQRIVDRGRIVVFQPGNSKGDTIAARALKTRFYGAVFSRQNLHRPIGIVIDEAHRFVTQDRNGGEQDLLDRCRSYRTNVVLATQSLRSLEHAMGSGSAAKDAVRILVANTPTRFLMRSTEPDSSELLRQLLPPPPSPGPHVADVRPPSQLVPGEAYWLLADGRWGRSRAQLQHIK